MPTISTVCTNLFTQTNLAKLPKVPDRASRRNLARRVYRVARRPGLINPVPQDQLPPAPGNPKSNKARCVHKTPRHVVKLHEPGPPKRRLLRDAIPKFAHCTRFFRSSQRRLAARRAAEAEAA
jgi:hypothetical protein